jgi:hypothetical protein
MKEVKKTKKIKEGYTETISVSDLWRIIGKSMGASDDMSDAAKAARNISSYFDLDGLEPLIKIGIETDKGGVYPDKNKVMSIITPDNKAYKSHMTDFGIPF